MKRALAAVGAALLTLALAGCTSVDGRVYDVKWFKSGSCFVYAKGTVDGETHYKAIRVGRNDTRAECYGDHKVGDRIRFTVGGSFRQDQ